MLTSVPESIAYSTRQVVLRHPNAMDCTVWRKKVTRVENDPISGEPSEMGASPTLGGMGVLRSEDEAEIEYEELGPGKCMFCGIYQPSDETERGNALVQAQQQEAQIESTKEQSEEGWFLADSGDLILIEPGLGTVLAFEVATLSGLAHIPPYIRKLVLNPRDDLHSLEPFLP